MGTGKEGRGLRLPPQRDAFTGDGRRSGMTSRRKGESGTVSENSLRKESLTTGRYVVRGGVWTS